MTEKHAVGSGVFARGGVGEARGEAEAEDEVGEARKDFRCGAVGVVPDKPGEQVVHGRGGGDLRGYFVKPEVAKQFRRCVCFVGEADRGRRLRGGGR